MRVGITPAAKFVYLRRDPFDRSAIRLIVEELRMQSRPHRLPVAVRSKRHLLIAT
jgi:hypothetical protein